MDSKLKGSFTLSEEEWIILAFGLGVPSIFGFPKTNIPPDRESVLRAVNELINKKFIEPNGENFKVLLPYRDAVLRTGNVKTLFIRTRSDRLPDFMCYFGEPLLLCEPMPQKRDAYRFEFSDEDEIWERLITAGYFPEDEYVLGKELDLEKASDMEDELLSGVFQNKDLDAFSPIVFWMELITADKRNNKFLSVVEHPLFRYILTDTNGERTRELYNNRQARIMFLDFLREANT